MNIPKVRPRAPRIKDWPAFWAVGDKTRLPEFYKRHFEDMHTRAERAIHYVEDKRKWIVDHEHGIWKLVKNIPIPIMYPHQADMGLWGGEGIIAGYYLTNDPRNEPHAKLWNPVLRKFIFQSELLNKHYALMVTRSTVEQIEDAEGFDEYILKTHPVDLKSNFGMILKREMLHALCYPDSIRPDNKELSEELFERLKKYCMPENEIDWQGLGMVSALKKMYKEEDAVYESNIRPWKDIYRDRLLKRLQDTRASGQSELTASSTEELPDDILELSAARKELDTSNRPKSLFDKMKQIVN